MKAIKSTVIYTVPHWNFCNSDNLLYGEITNRVCKFCVKSNDGPSCLLYGTPLSLNDGLISKTKECCRATAGFEVEVTSVTAPRSPAIKPQDIVKQAIDSYSKTVQDLINQGYPRQMAETAARKYILDN